MVGPIHGVPEADAYVTQLRAGSGEVGTTEIADAAITTQKLSTTAKTYAVAAEFGTVAAGTDDERAVFVAPVACTLTKAYLVNGAALAADTTNYTTITLRDKGGAGTADNQIASYATDSNAFVAFDSTDMGTLDATHKVLAAGDVVTLKKADSGTGAATDTLLVVLHYTPNDE